MSIGFRKPWELTMLTGGTPVPPRARRSRVLAAVSALAVMTVPVVVSGCQGGADRQAAGAASEADSHPACGAVSSAKTCILDANSGGPDFGQTVVLNGASVLFADATGRPAGPVAIVDACWAPADEVEPTDCTSAGKSMPPKFVAVTAVDGFPAVTFDAPKIPDTTQAGEEVYPLPGYVDVSVDGRTVRIEIACCEKI